MISVFDLDKLRGLLQDFYRISHIRITVFDENLRELVAWPEKVPPCCAIIRSCARGYDACMACDRQACQVAAQRRRTWVYRCHAGLTEAVTPLYVGDVLAGYLLFGHLLAYASHEEGWAVIRQRCSGMDIDASALREAIFHAPLTEEDYIRSASQILHVVASYLILERMATLKEDLLCVRLDAYLNEHFAGRCSASQVSGDLGIGKTQLYELTQQLYGCGVAERVRALRMEKAKTLLLQQPALSMAEIASRCGYADYNYFITVFSREVGISPGAWRRSRQSDGR